jgi:hypothetical protein
MNSTGLESWKGGDMEQSIAIKDYDNKAEWNPMGQFM